MFKKKNNLQTAIAVACMSASLCAPAIAATAKPNVVTIMIDDMGFSDIGAFGGEISTPNLDYLVNQGTQLTNYYSAPTSTPARAMFFTGRDNHAAGVGNMDGYSPDRPPQTATQATSDEYKGRLTKALPTFPELLKNNGYYTMMTGKWDLGDTPGEYASDRGFTQSLVLIPGGDIQYLGKPDGSLNTSQPPTYYSGLIDPRTGSKGTVTTPYYKNGVPIDNAPGAFPANAFSTDYYTDEAIKMLDARDTTKPFYLNVAHIASHAPFQAPSDLIQKYLPIYSQGWDKLRAERFNKLKALGLIKPDAVLPPRDVEVSAWNKLSSQQQQVEAMRMAAYAGLVDKLDQSIGKLIQHLKDIGQYDNTVFFVMSDNGAAAIESGNPAKQAWVAANFTKDTIANVANIGSSTSFIPAAEGLGMLSNTPFNRYKAETFEGGIHTAAVIFSPKAPPAAKGAKYNCLSSVMDWSATILNIAKVAYPKTYTYTPLPSATNPNPTPITVTLPALDGQPLNNVLAGDLSCKNATRALGFEQDSAKMMRQGDWKLGQQFNSAMNRWDGHFYLFNIANDPFELHDLSQAYPDVNSKMLSLYNSYAVKNQVINVGPRLFSPIANLKIADATNALVSGGMILGGSQVNHVSIEHVPTLPQTATVPPAPPRPVLAAPKLGTDIVDIAAEIYPPKAQQGMAANVMVAAYYKPATGAGEWTAFRRAYDPAGNIVSSTVPLTSTVDGSSYATGLSPSFNFKAVPTFSAAISSFPDRVELPIYEGKVMTRTAMGAPSFKAGTYYFWVGYKLSNGTINHSATPIVLNVTP